MTRKVCARCGRERTPRVTFPDGPVCWRCYIDATSTVGPCATCNTERLLVGRRADGAAVCRDCGGVHTDFRCPRCGGEAEIYRKGSCLRCCLRDDLTTLLDDGTGQPSAAMYPLVEQIATMRRPRNALAWLADDNVRALLTGLANGSIPLTHDALDEQPHPHTINHLRRLLTQAGALPARDERLEQLLRYCETRIKAVHDDADRRIVRTYITWQRLRPLRARSEAHHVDDTATAYIRQELQMIVKFIDWLHSRDRRLGECDQALIDEWLVTGSTTRDKIRRFITWAVTHHHITGPCDVPYRRTGPAMTMIEDKRIELLRRLLDTTVDVNLGYRLAGVLVLLYGLPFERIKHLALTDVETHNCDTWLRVSDEPLLLPPRVAELLDVQIAHRRNMGTAANATSPWLFPGRLAGQPITTQQLLTRTRDLGIHLRGGRNAALRDLLLTVPVPVLASVLGYDPATLERHCAHAGTTWVTYASYRSAAAD
jgi:hypothetical protein